MAPRNPLSKQVLERKKLYDSNRLKDPSLCNSDIEGAKSTTQRVRAFGIPTNFHDDIRGSRSASKGFKRFVESNPVAPQYDTDSKSL